MRGPRWKRWGIGATLVTLALAGCARSAQDHVERGDAYLAKGEVEAASLEYRNAVERDPKLATARQKLADLHLRQGNRRAALAEVVRIADLLPDDVEAQLKAGALLLEAGRAEDARARAEKAMALDPKNGDALMLRANALAGLNDLDGAIAQIRKALALGVSADRESNLAMLLHAKGLPDEAEAAFRRALSTAPKSVPAHLALAQFLWNTGRMGEAESTLQAALAIDPGNTTAHRTLATLYVTTNRPADAERHFKQVADSSADPAAKLALAEYYVGAERVGDARAVLEQLSTLPAAWAAARSRLASLLYAQGETAAAHRTIDEVIARQATYSHAHVVRGQFLATEGRTDEAMSEAEQALKLDPGNAQAHFLKGTAHETRKELDAAARAFAEVLRLNPRASAAQVRLAAIELQRGAPAAAVQLAGEASQAEPASPVAQLVLARALLAQGDIDRASLVTTRLLREFPTDAATHAQAGMLAYRRGDRSGARASFERSLALNPLQYEPLAALTAMDTNDGHPDAARARIDARLKATPRDSAVLVLAARTWRSTGDAVRAEAFLRQAIEVDASNFDAFAALGQLFIAQGKLDQALREFDQLSDRLPGVPGPPTMAALIAQSRGQEEDARRRLERVVEAHGSAAAVASNNLAYLYATRGEQLDRALQLAQAAVAAMPESPDVNDTLGFVYIKKQLPSLAIPPLRLASQKAPANPQIRYHLGLAYSLAGDKQAARQALEESLELQSEFEGAVHARQILATLK